MPIRRCSPSGKTAPGEKLELMIQYATTHRCRRQMILDYFGDEAEVSDCACDVCRRGREPAMTAGAGGDGGR